MAPSASLFDTDQIKEKAKKDILYLLEGIRGKKNLVLERSLAGPIGSFVKFSNLQDYGVDKIFYLENDNADTSQRNVVFIARGENLKQIRYIADHVKRIQRKSQTGHEFSVFWVPRRTLVSDNLLEEAGVLGDLNVSEFPLYFLPLEKDLLSLELDESFADIYVRKDPTSIFLLARAIMSLQQKHGLFPRIIGKGENAKKLTDFLARMRLELVAGEDPNDIVKIALTLSSNVESLIIIDREIDYATPLLSQLTYKGMIDEVFQIQNNQIEVESSLLGAVPQSSSGTPVQSKQRKILLDSSDKLFDQLRDQNFATVGNFLNRVARRLQTDYESRHGTKTTAELREFVNKLPAYQTEQQNLNIHTNLTEEIMKHTQTDRFTKLLEVQQNLVTGADPSSQHEMIEELISRDMPVSDVLRLLCLESCLSVGIKPRDLESFKKMILQAYGYQHILTFHALEKAQLLTSRNSPVAMIIPVGGAYTSHVGNKTNYSYLRKALKLVVEEVDEHNPNDISYVYSGYAPLSVRIVQSILQKYHMTSLPRGENAKNPTAAASNQSQAWRAFGEDMKYVRGPIFDIMQKGEDWAVKARAMLNTAGTKKIVFIVFLGGITFTEIAALRFMAKNETRRQIIICTTSIISGGRIMDMIIEKGKFGNSPE